MANINKGLKKLRKRVEKLAEEVSELRTERHSALTTEAADEPAAAKPNRATDA
jgi:hypothetical protein